MRSLRFEAMATSVGLVDYRLHSRFENCMRARYYRQIPVHPSLTMQPLRDHLDMPAGVHVAQGPGCRWTRISIAQRALELHLM
jgi:hypothetical protein